MFQASHDAPLRGAGTPDKPYKPYEQASGKEEQRFDWPIGDDDLAPYYDKVEMLVGIYGSNEGLEKRYLPTGTFALQGHDPGSETHFRNIRVKVLP